MYKVEDKYKNFQAYSMLFISSFIYGGNVIAGRLIAGVVPPLALSAMRVLLGLAILLPLAWPQMKRAPKPNLIELGQLFFIGALGITVPFITLLLGLEQTTGTNASIVLATMPAVTNTLLFLICKIKPSKYQTIGMITSFLGLVIVFTHGSLRHILNFKIGLGEIYLFMNVLSIGLFNILGQNIMKKFSSIVTSVYAMTFATLTLIPLGTWQLTSFGWSFSWSTWLIIFYMSFLAAGIAFYFNLYGINKIGSGQAAMFGNLQHIWSISLSVLILKESLALYHYLGFILVIGGVILSLRQPPPKKTSPILKQNCEQSG